MLSVIVTTRDEESNIAACAGAWRGELEAGVCEIVVVDNASSDRTKVLAAEAGARVFDQGPERSAQRNRGVREARGDVLLFLDADMVVPEAARREILALEDTDLDAAYVRETRSGTGLRARARDFERSFYDGTCIDCVRWVRKSVFERVGGFDTSLCGVEDWDFDRRVSAAGFRTAVTREALIHNEAALSLRKVLRKKAYYAETFDLYKEKWGRGDPVIRKQFGMAYRLWGVFMENGKWRNVLRHPVLWSVMMAERVCVGVVYLFHR